jgi:polar amino acid transport system permease protein
MFIAYFGLPAFGLYITDFVSVSIALVLYAAAFVCEITRSGILSVPKAQVEAGRAIGLRPRQILSLIVFPQAVRSSLGPFLAHCVIMIKTTAYVSVVGVWELSYAAHELTERTLAPFQIFFGAMCLYFVICYPISVAARNLERRANYAA